MTSLDEKREQRLRFLHLLYERTGGDEHQYVSMWDLGQELGLERSDINVVMQYLKGEGLAEYKALGGIVGITHWGVKQVEEALLAPEEETTYFPPAVNILHIGTNIGSPIQQGSPRAEQHVGVDADSIAVLRSELERLSEELASLRLPPEDEAELRAQTSTALAQLGSRAPEMGIIRSSLNRMQPLLTAGAAAGHAAEHFPKLIELLGKIL